MTLFLLCLKIFCARIMDVSLGTLRTLMTVKGKIIYAAIIGFVEICIWFTIVREALNTDETSIFIMVAYAGGYATGTLFGGLISKVLIKGNLGVQVITKNIDLIKAIRDAGYAVSVMDIKGQDENIDRYMLYIEINNHSFVELRNLIEKNDNKAFLVVNETKYVQNGFIK